MSGKVAATAGDRGRPSARQVMDVILMLTGSVFTGLLTIVMAPIMPQVTEHFGHESNARVVAQMIMVLPCIGVVFAGPVMGGLIDRWGIRVVVLWSSLLYALCGMIGFFADSTWVLVVSRILLGVAGSGIYAGSFALIGERYEGAKRQSILGYKGAVGAGNATMVVLSAGFIGQAWGWRAVFVLYLLAVPIFLMALGLKSERRERHPVGGKPPMRLLLPLWPVLVLMVLVFSLTYSSLGQGGHLLAEKGLTRPGVIAILMACASIAYMVSSALYGVTSRIVEPTTTFRLGLFVFGVGLIGVALGSGTVALGVWMFTLGLGNGMTAPYLHNLVLEKAAPEIRGTASGFVSPAHYGAEFINPPIFQLMSGFGDIARSFLILAVASIAGALVLRPNRWAKPPVPVPVEEI